MDQIRYFQSEKEQHKHNLRIVTNYRVHQQIMRKEQLEHDEQHYKKFLVQKWDILKQKKRVMLEEAKERQKQRNCISKWIICMQTHQYLKEVLQQFEKRKSEFYRKVFQKKCAFRFQRVWGTFLKKIDKTRQNARSIKRSKYDDENLDPKNTFMNI